MKDKQSDKLRDDSFADMISQADDREFNIESPKSKMSKVENWLVKCTSETRKTENFESDTRKTENFEVKKRKSENSSILQNKNKQFCNDPFTTENYVNSNRTENYANSNRNHV